MPECSLTSAVDDNPPFRHSLRRLAESHGYAIAVLSSSAEILASTQLPATSDVESDSHVRAAEHVRPTTLIAAHFDGIVRQRMLGLDVGSFLAMPLDKTAPMDCLRADCARVPNAEG